MDPAIRIRVNGDERELDDGATLSDLLREFDLTPQRVAIEVNERLVKRADYGATLLRDGDRVEIVTLVGGG